MLIHPQLGSIQQHDSTAHFTSVHYRIITVYNIVTWAHGIRILLQDHSFSYNCYHNTKYCYISYVDCHLNNHELLTLEMSFWQFYYLLLNPPFNAENFSRFITTKLFLLEQVHSQSHSGSFSRYNLGLAQ